MKVLDLFSGIGGFSLGLERAGMKTIAFCEIDEKCRQVLKKHWPDVPQYKDIKTLSWEKLKNDGIEKPDVICGGFPCQDISVAGKQEGINGERSGLWFEFKRLIKEIKPDFAVIENVENLRSKGLVTVLQDLWSIRYDAEWHIIPAWSIGAIHRRERIWIIAYPNEKRLQKLIGQKKRGPGARLNSIPLSPTWSVRDTSKAFILRGADGLPGRVDRIKQLGNAVVPQIPELIGRAILSTEDHEL